MSAPRSALAVVLIACFCNVAPAQQLATSPEPQADAPGMKVRLLAAGEAPRSLMRMKPAKGAKQVTVMSMDMQQKMSLNGTRLPTPRLPSQKVTIEMGVVDVNSEGDIEMNFEYTGWEVVADEAVQPAVVSSIETMLKPMIGTSGSLVVTDRGIPLDSQIEIPENVSPQIRSMVGSMSQSMKQIGAPLPEEPVGVGGRWSVEADVEANGMKIKQTTVYEVLAIDNGTYTLGVTVGQEAEEQVVDSPQLPAGAKMTLKSLDSEGKGKMVLNSASLAPRSDVSLTSTAEMKIEAGGQAQEMAIETKMTMGFADAETEAAP